MNLIKQHETGHGQIIILNGVPRAGKSSIAKIIQETFEGLWINLGVDNYMKSMPPVRFSPGIGLRPGGERPDLEPLIAKMYSALYGSVVAHSKLGINVVMDTVHHEWYNSRMGILQNCAKILSGLPVLFVAVKCPIEVIMQRRNEAQNTHPGIYLGSTPETAVPEAVLKWQRSVHEHDDYDLAIDTSVTSASEAAEAIKAYLKNNHSPVSAFERIAKKTR